MSNCVFNTHSSFAIFSGVYFRTKTIKGAPVVQLVESFLNPERQLRQRILASLGDAHVPDTK